ncbi:MAG: DNA-methyltransferase [Candidatus Bathyarchaeia archaeon]
MSGSDKTSTSDFGVSKRESHDSSVFYNRRLYENIRVDENIGEIHNEIPENLLNSIILHDSKNMSILPDSSVHLMVTSPPYNVGKKYDDDLDLGRYLGLLSSVFSETYRVLIPGGRACINIANVGRKPYLPYHKYIMDLMLEIGFLMRGEIIWNKDASAGTSTAWGSWMSASNPVLRDIHEYILVFSKNKFSREKGKRINTISKEEFLEYTKSIWTFPTESASKVGHPAPFPVELPERCIKLFSFKNDVVLDPFCGVATTAIACLTTGRRYICFDNEQKYINSGKKRVEEYLLKQSQTKMPEY